MKVAVFSWPSGVLHAGSPDGHRQTVEELKALIADHRVEMIGPIRQKLLSGIRNTLQFERLQNHVTAFPDIPIGTEDYEMVAKFYNLCRSKGIQHRLLNLRRGRAKSFGYFYDR